MLRCRSKGRLLDRAMNPKGDDPMTEAVVVQDPKSKKRCRVVLVDDHAMVREALAQTLADYEWIEVVGQGDERHEAIRVVQRLMPDVLVLDYSIPGGGALPVIETLVNAHWASTKILVLTVHESFHYAVRVLQSGADGYAIKSAAVQELANAIRMVRDGEVYIAPSLSRDVLDRLRQPRHARKGLDALSPREFELLRSLGEGKTLKDAADSQGISVSTASTYRGRLMEKLDLSTTAELIRFALENDVAS